MPFPLLATLGTLLPSIGSIFQSSSEADVAKQNTDKTIAANKEMAEYQYSKDLEMWNRGNTYNSPQAQMERLKAAGLNPNLVYGNGSAANTTAVQMPKYNAPTMQYNYKPPINIPDAIGTYQDFQIKQAQLDNLKAQRSAIEQSTILNRFKTDIAGSDRDVKWQTANSRILSAQWKEQSDWAKQNLSTQAVPYQLSSLQLKNRQQDTGISKMMQDIEKAKAGTTYQNLVNEWYTTKLIGQFGLGIMNALPKLGIPKSMPRLNQRTSGAQDREWLKRMKTY